MNTQPVLMEKYSLDELPVDIKTTIGAANGDYARVAGWLTEARKVVVRVGGGSRGAEREIQELLDLVDGVAVVSPLASGVVPFSSRRNMTVGGSKGSLCGNYAMEQADLLVAIGGGWNLPPSYPNFCATWIEITGTEGSLFLDDTHRDNWLNTVEGGTRYPMSTMPGEQVDHVFAGQMGPETLHFLESCILDRPVMVTPESARMVMQCYLAADLSAERNAPVDIPLNNEAMSGIADMIAANRKLAAGGA
jgi:hypothetical protein